MTGTAGPSQLLYLEPDDEITSVIRRLREADPGRVVLVASGRSKATTSVVALRLLAGVAAEEGREIALVADSTGRSLAAEAGIPAFASVADASGDNPQPVEPAPIPSAPIRVVRGDATAGADGEAAAAAGAAALAATVAGGAAATPPRAPVQPMVAGRNEETQAVPLPAPAPTPTPQRRPAAQATAGVSFGRRLPRVAVGVLIGLLLLAAVAAAAVAPAATVVIKPATVSLDPVTYTLTVPAAGSDEGDLSATADGTATGQYSNPTTAAGSVTIYNYSYVTVEIPQGTQVSADGAVFFATTERVIADPGGVSGLLFQPSETEVGVVALDPGPSGNVAADAINRIENARVDGFLKGFPGLTGRRVRNADSVTGGAENAEPEVTQGDVDAAVAEIQADLTAQLQNELQEDPSRVYGPVDAGDPVVDEPSDLVGRRGQDTFQLEGTLSYRRDYAERSAVEGAAVDQLVGDETVQAAGMQVLPDTADVTVDDVTEAGGQLQVVVTVRAEATPAVDVDEVRNRIAGMTDLQAIETLRGLGDVSVELWPGWIDHVPRFVWRIDVRVEPAASPQPSP
jgi:hypothetical protein